MTHIDYISCIFVKDDIARPQPSPLRGVQVHTEASAIEYMERLKAQELDKYLIFGIVEKKSVTDDALETSIVPKVLRSAKSRFGSQVTLIADVGLSPYRDDGHSTIIQADGKIDETKSYMQASGLAVKFARAGADMVAPCLSLPRQVSTIREALDREGLHTVKIMSYSAKFSSSMYGPYRATIGSPLGVSKKAYQTDYADTETALNAIIADDAQHADIVMVKPGAGYLDILWRARQLTKKQLAVYHVSGEYSMILCAHDAGMIDRKEAFDEIHAAFERCGADFVIGYAPEEFVRWRDARRVTNSPS